MPNNIKILPQNIINIIAAGEVIQRPSSVIKELLENSIDANATIIKINIKEAGKKLIQTIDNGIGMNEQDATLCFENHSTSKLNSYKDLFSIKTMGFRGEALSSIAAISQVELKTSQNTNSLGTKVLVEQNKIKSTLPITMQKGTNISVKNLFSNVPARRAFLKSNNIEFKCILDEFFRIAIANCHIEFYFYNDNKLIYSLPETKLNQRIVNIFGKTYKEQMLPCKEDLSDIKIFGYIGKPEHAKKSINDKFTYANNRFIKSTVIYGAIKNAYENLIKFDHTPFFALFIEINPKLMDINIHPNKIDVKFEDEKLVCSIIKSAVKKALASYHISPTIDFTKQNIINELSFNFDKKLSYNEEQYTEYNTLSKPQKKEIIDKTWEEIKENTTEVEDFKQTVLNSAINNILVKETLKNKNEPNFIKFGYKYLIIKFNDEIKIINLIAAQRRIIYDRIVDSQTDLCGQKLLMPTTIEMPETKKIIIKENLVFLKKTGFSFEFLDNKIIVLSIPTSMQKMEIPLILDNIIHDLEHNNYSTIIDNCHAIAMSIANISVKKNINTYSEEEIMSIIEQLFASKNPIYTPDGYKILTKLSLEEIDKLFGISKE